MIQIRKTYPVLTEGKEVRRICDDANGVLTIEREMENVKATVVFDVKKYTVAITIACNGEIKFDKLEFLN